MDGDVSQMRKAGWKAGVGAVPITPRESMWLAGWAARKRPAEGAAGELFAKALAVEDPSGRRALIITVELIAVSRELARAVANQVQARWGIPRNQVLFNASHTHTGPEVRPDKVPFFEIPAEFAAKIGRYVAGLEEQLVAVGGQAIAASQPVDLSAHRAQAAFAHNRRSPGGPVDREVPVLKATGTDGRVRAVLFGYACHNLTLPPSFCQYHGDYAGVAQRCLEAAHPGATALFLAGAGADQDPVPAGTLAMAEEHGRTLAGAVAASLAGPGTPVAGGLGSSFEEVLLDFMPLPAREELEAEAHSAEPPRQRKAKFLLAALAENRPLPTSYPCPVQVLRFGQELLLIALGGEPVAEYALKFKAEFAGPLVWVAGYANDMFGYVPTRQVQIEGGYEAGRAMLWSALPSRFTETVEERVVDTVRRLVRET